ADARDAGGEALDHVDPLRGERRGDAEDPDQQRVRDYSEGHAERAVDQLRGETDGDERKQRNKVEIAEMQHAVPRQKTCPASRTLLNQKDRESFEHRSEAISRRMRPICGSARITPPDAETSRLGAI